MKKLILIVFLTFSTTLLANSNLGVRIQTNIGNTSVGVNFRSDDHRYDKRYKNFNYKRYGYYDNYGYYFGYFDKRGYFFNNIFFLYNSKYTYYDRLHRRGYFRPSHAHYRKYEYTRGNNWNKNHRYRNKGEVIYGHYYEKHVHHDKRKANYKRSSHKSQKKVIKYKKNFSKHKQDKNSKWDDDKHRR